MADETTIGSAGATDGPGHSDRGSGEQSPLQARAPFLKNRNWELVIRLNRGACERGCAQHGLNPETQAATAEEWKATQNRLLSLNETLEFLRHCHRRAPFLFFNGNTFADVGRQIAAAIFAELPATRLREITSAVAHYIAGVLDHESMEQIVNELCAATGGFHPGDRVHTLKGSLHGTIKKVLPDGRVLWRPDKNKADLIALPETLLKTEKG